MFGDTEPGSFVLTFNRAGEVDIAPPTDLEEGDLALLDHILGAVREATLKFNQAPS